MGVAAEARQTSSLTASWMVACAPQLQLPDSSQYMQVPSAAVDQLKQRLLLAVENGNPSDAIEVIAQLEKSPLTKEILEATRIGATVNDVRKRTGSSFPDLSKKCRGLIKLWQKLLENRPSSSNGTSSNGGTPNTPCIRRGLTPQTPGRKCTPSARTQLVSPDPNGTSYAPQDEKVPSKDVHLPKSHSVGSELCRAESRMSGKNTSPIVKLSRKRTAETTSSPEAIASQKRPKPTENQQKQTPSTSPSTPHVSVLAARRQNAVPTSNLLAQLYDDPVNRQLGKAIQKPLTPAINQKPLTPAKPERKATEKPATPRMKVATPPVSNGVAAKLKPATIAGTVSVAPVPSPALGSQQDKDKEKEKKEKDKEKRKNKTPKVVPKSDPEEDNLYLSDDEAVPVQPKPTITKNWYSDLPSREMLAARAAFQASPVTNPRKTVLMKIEKRPNPAPILVLPYSDVGLPDFAEYKYADAAKFIANESIRR